jgi:hypothetical protein
MKRDKWTDLERMAEVEEGRAQMASAVAVEQPNNHVWHVGVELGQICSSKSCRSHGGDMYMPV